MTNTETSSKDDLTNLNEPEECTVSEEYSALSETFFSLPINDISKEEFTFHKKKYEISDRLRKAIDDCSKRFIGRKELASEQDNCVAELCEALEEAFQYGLKPNQQTQLNFVASAANLFQNMQEIVIGSSSNKSLNTLPSSAESFFWDFCQNFLTPHEKERFEKLKQVWTKWGKGRSFIRASLNEHSLRRYILTWLSEESILNSYYSDWSLLLDVKLTKSLTELLKSLDNILFALSVDKTELNNAVKTESAQQRVVKEEPIIYAPCPVKVEHKIKRKSAAVERLIASTNSTEDLTQQLQENSKIKPEESTMFYSAMEEIGSLISTLPPDPIEPELEFLKQPLEFTVTSQITPCPMTNGSISSANSYNDSDEDASSQSSKYSFTYQNASNNCVDSKHLHLEQQLKEVNERCTLLETRVAQLSLENRQLIRRLKQHFEVSGIDPSSSFATNFLITIPHVKLHKAKHTTSSFHLYEIHITMRHNLEHWSLCRRYSDFNKLHKSLCKTHPIVSSVEFPPKKRFGNMNVRFVDERRQQLQIYLLNLAETLPQVEACKSKSELQKVFPFLRER